jgi:hypothetical protein
MSPEIIAREKYKDTLKRSDEEIRKVRRSQRCIGKSRSTEEMPK